MINSTALLILLSISCILNVIADILLFWGVRYRYTTNEEVFVKTPRSFLLVGALSGLFILPFWFLPAPYLLQVDGLAGNITFFSYVTYIAILLLFHVSYSFIGLGIKADRSLGEIYTPVRSAIGAYSFLVALIFTISMVYIGVQQIWVFSWYHYLILPFPILLIALGLGNLLKRIPWFRVTSGTLSMFVFFVGFVDLINRNSSVF
jgi:hypothetical protein